MLAGLLHRLRTRRSWPKPCQRPEGYAVEDETWPEYIPAGPMTSTEAEMHRILRRICPMPTRPPYSTQDARNDTWCDIWAVGLAARQHEALEVLRHGMAQRGRETPEEAERQRQAQQGRCEVDQRTLMCRTHACDIRVCWMHGQRQ